MSKETVKPKNSIWESIKTIVYAVCIALVFRSLFFQPFSIPSGSMKPTLLVGDYLFVSKYAYGYSKYSFPLSLPLFDGRIFASEPERGDVVVFRYPQDDRIDYIKRVIGLPGDTVQMKQGVVWLNGKPLQRGKLGHFDETKEPQGPEGRPPICMNDPVRAGSICRKDMYEETLPTGKIDNRTYRVLDANNSLQAGSDNTSEFTVPAGHYFFLGDNRDNSLDSRFSNGVGMVPFENLVGKAEVVFLSSTTSPFAFWNWRMDRFVTVID